MRSTSAYARAVLLPCLIIVTFELLTRSEYLPPAQAAAPSDVAVQFFRLIFQGDLIHHWFYSLSRLMIGVLIGLAIGTLSGLILANARVADQFIGPTLQVLAGVPVVVWLPFWIWFLGTGEAFKIGLIATAAFFLAHVSAYSAARNVAVRYTEVAQMYEKTLREKLIAVVFPSVIPPVLTGARISLALGWVVIFFAESAAALQGSEGLGWFVFNARQVGRLEDEYAGLLALALTGFVVDWCVGKAQRWTDGWNQTVGAAS